jgi:predicted RNase H-like nuclease (RuvC/YqgF family)
MTKKYNIAETENDIRYRRSAIKRYEKKVSKLQNEINWYKSYIEKDTASLAKLQEEFITSKMAAV